MSQLAFPKPTPNRDETRLEHCRQLPCLIIEYGTNGEAVAQHTAVCDWAHAWEEERRCDPHHVRTAANSGTGTKPGHDRIVPLCRHGHDEHDDIGAETFSKKYGLDLVLHAERVSLEFERTHGASKRTRQPRKPIIPAMKFIRAQCPCGLVHDLSPMKIHRYGSGLRYRCPKTNEMHALRIVG